jgi:hypothetical protein
MNVEVEELHAAQQRDQGGGGGCEACGVNDGDAASAVALIIVAQKRLRAKGNIRQKQHGQ